LFGSTSSIILTKHEANTHLKEAKLSPENRQFYTKKGPKKALLFARYVMSQARKIWQKYEFSNFLSQIFCNWFYFQKVKIGKVVGNQPSL
jgi:hypothetical protein